MKRLFILFVMLSLGITSSPAQSKKAQKAAAKQLKQEVARFTSEGWTVAPGALPLSEQLSRAWDMRREFDDDGLPKYQMADAMSVAANYDAAKLQALELAKLELAGQLQNQIVAEVENEVANEQLGQEDAETITRMVMAGKNRISQSIGRVIPVVECYRTKPNKHKEVRVEIAYNSQLALELAKKSIRKQLSERGDAMLEKLDAMFEE